MVLISNFAIQGAQMMLVLLLAPLFTGYVRKVKARLVAPAGPAAPAALSRSGSPDA